MRNHVWVILALMAVAPVHSAAQPLRLSLEEAIEHGLAHSRTLNASLLNSRVEDAKAGEIAAARLPVVKFAGLYTRLSDLPASTVSLPGLPGAITLSPSVLDNYNLGVSVQQPLFTGFKLERMAEMADLSSKAAQREYEKDKADLVYNIKVAYWNTVRVKEMLRLVDENISQMEAHLRDVRNLQEQGIATMSDVLRVQVQLSEVRMRQLDVRNSLQIASLSLNNLIGVPLDAAVELTTTISRQPRSFEELSRIIPLAQERRQELQAMSYRVRAAEASVGVATSNWWPSIMLVGNYSSARPNQRVFPTTDEFRDTWNVNIVVSYDLWNWGTTAYQSEEARARAEQAKLGFEQTRELITLDVTGNYLTLQKAKERIDVARESVDQAEENARMTGGKFRQGLASNTDVLDAEMALLLSKTGHTQALIDFELAAAALERSIGE